MMAFGSSNGSNIYSASSSSLSPLAPPFTVTSRSDLNINAAPYAIPYTTGTQLNNNWGNSRPRDYYKPETVTSSLFPSSIVYSSVSPPMEAQTNRVVCSESSLTESNFFSHFPSLITNDFGDGNYYGEPSSSWDNISASAQNEIGNQSNSARVSQDNYTQSLYGLQYPSLWDRSCDGRLDIESGGNNSFLGRTALGVPNSTSASAYQNYVKEGSDLPKVLGKSSGEPWVPQISNVSDVRCNPVGSLGTDAVVDNSFPKFNANETYVSPLSAVPSITSGIFFTATPDISVMDSWGFTPPTATNIKVQKQHISNHSPVLTSFNQVTTGHPSAVRSSTTSGSLAPQNDVMHSNNDLFGKSDDIIFDNIFNVKDSWVCQRSKQGNEIKECMDVSASSIDPQKYDTNVLLFPTRYGEPSGIKNVTSGPLDDFKHEAPDMHSNRHNLEGFSSLNDEPDQYNPSEDSPCWKGSSSYFSQFQVSEAIPSQHHLKNKHSYDELNLNEPQKFPLSCVIPTTKLSTDSHEKRIHSINGCAAEAETLLSSTQSGYIGNQLYDEPKREANHTVYKLGATEPNSGNGFCYPNENHKSVESVVAEMEPLRVQNPEPSNHIRRNMETICRGSGEEKAAACFRNTDVNLNDAPEECQSYVPSNAAKQVLSSLSSDADISSELNQKNWDEYATESKSMLLKTIVNLSDSLLFYYLNDENPVGNDDYKILELVLSKLTMCLKFAREKSLAKECSSRVQGTSNVSSEVQVYHDLFANLRGIPLEEKIPQEITNKPQVTKGIYHEDGAMLASNFEGFHKTVRADGTEEVASMTKVIKDVLDANFHEETETQMHPLATMYKNLWLEAEAVLCSTNYKARYHRMKNEMEKSESHEEKEKSLECKGSPTRVEASVESSTVGKSVHAADVMERYNILKCRAETSEKGIGSDLGSSKFSSDQRNVNKLSTQVDGHTTSETFIKGANTGCQSHDGLSAYISRNPSATSVTSTYHTDVAEDHVISRLQILKSRGEYPKYTEHEGQPSELTVDSVSKKDCSPVVGGEQLDGRFEPNLNRGITKDKLLSSEYGLEGVECQKFAHNREMVELGVQFSGGWYENTSSDWEHVLKDEFTWTGGAINP